MFHSDEVNVEAILYFNHVLNRFSDISEVYFSEPDQRLEKYYWFKKCPKAVLVIGSTKSVDDLKVLTEVACFVVYCEKRNIYAFQYHPELFDIQLAKTVKNPKMSELPDYKELKKMPNVILLISVIAENIN